MSYLDNNKIKLSNSHQNLKIFLFIFGFAATFSSDQGLIFSFSDQRAIFDAGNIIYIRLGKCLNPDTFIWPLILCIELKLTQCEEISASYDLFCCLLITLG